MPSVIKHFNDPNHAVTLSGKPIERKQSIFLRSYNQWFPVLQTSMHFCFTDYSQPRGSTLFCTCGSFAEIVGYHAYKNLNSFIGNEVIVCHHYIQHKVHADGSHE